MALVDGTLVYERTGLVRSPQKFVIYDDSGTLYDATCTLELKCWQGHKTTDKPSTPTFTLYNPSVTADIGGTDYTCWYFEVSEYIRQYCNYAKSFGEGFGAHGCWVEASLFSVPQAEGEPLTLSLDEEFHTIGWYSQVNNSRVRIITNPTSLAGANLQGRAAATYPEITYFNERDYNPIPYCIYDTGNDEIEFHSMTSGNTYTASLSASNESEDQISYYDATWSQLGVLGFTVSERENELIRVRVQNTSASPEYRETFYLKYYDCYRNQDYSIPADSGAGNRYVNHTLYFVNRYGGMQSFLIRGRIQYSLEQEGEDYLAQIANNIGRASSFQQEHQTKRYNVTGRNKINITLGRLTADENEVLIDILMSERIWLQHAAFGLLPINLTTNNQEYYNVFFEKGDKVVTLEFEAAQPLILNYR